MQVSPEHPIGQLKIILDRAFTRILEPIRSRIPTLRIGMAGLDLSPLVSFRQLKKNREDFLDQLY